MLDWTHQTSFPVALVLTPNFCLENFLLYFVFLEDDKLRTWWHRVDNAYEGLEESLEILKGLQNDHDDIVGIMGFSQGARLAHLVVMLHQNDPNTWFPKLAFAIFFSGYDAPIPDNFSLTNSSVGKITLPSLHVWGRGDKLVTPDQSQALTEYYMEPSTLIHDGNHYVPTKAPQIQEYISFIRKALVLEAEQSNQDNMPQPIENSSTQIGSQQQQQQLPDEETTAMQEEEIQALEAIFFEEIEIQSTTFPMRYRMKLVPTEEEMEGSSNNWPPRLLTLDISYPFDYPLQSGPSFRLINELILPTTTDCSSQVTSLKRPRSASSESMYVHMKPSLTSPSA
eukprot:scaffold1309_cov62-Cylindrotheca_fusiformis.AAC.1